MVTPAQDDWRPARAQPGHRLLLLQGGDALFPALVAAMDTTGPVKLSSLKSSTRQLEELLLAVPEAWYWKPKWTLLPWMADRSIRPEGVVTWLSAGEWV